MPNRQDRGSSPTAATDVTPLPEPDRRRPEIGAKGPLGSERDGVPLVVVIRYDCECAKSDRV